MTGQLNQEFGLVQVRSDLWINPRAILFVEGFDDSVIINLNGTDKVISWSDWNDIRPHVVTLPAPAAGSVPAPQTVTISQAVDEAIDEDRERENRALAVWVRVDEVEKDTFYSKTSRSHRDMWRLRTTDGRQVNVFDHSDPLRDQKHLLFEVGYLDLFRSMEDGQVDHWTEHPIEIDVVTDGAFWKVVRINKRSDDAGPDPVKAIVPDSWGSLDDPTFLDEDTELIEWDDEGNVVHRITSEPPTFTAADFPNDPSFKSNEDE